MEYCGNCGAAVEGRFCRMCGAPVGSGDPGAAFAALPGYGHGYGAAEGAGTAEPTQMIGAQAGYGAQPTEMIAPTPTEFDGLFRTEDGQPGLHGQTQMLPPVTDAGYGQGSQGPGIPGARNPYRDRDDGPNRNVILATVGAVVVAAGVILGLLFLGNQGSSPGPANGPTAAAGPNTASGSASQGAISIPTDAVSSVPPSTAASSAPAGGFHGDSLPLGPGSQGDWVKWVQERLKQLGYYNADASGTFDQATAQAVQSFQASAGVTGDPASTVGAHTVVALQAAGSTPDLHLGQRSGDVSRLDSALKYAEGASLSGARYTMQTMQAVMRYQQAVGLPPTGQMDAATWAKLQSGTLGNSD